MLSKRHYIAIANTIHKHQDGRIFSIRVAVWRIAEELSNFFADDNDRFDYYRFITACGFSHPPGNDKLDLPACSTGDTTTGCHWRAPDTCKRCVQVKP